jgi:hypothetical protein
VYLIADVLTAQLLKAVWPRWNPERYTRVLRVPSPIYHHDLAKLVDVPAYWGNFTYRITTNSLGFKDSKMRRVALQPSGRRVVIIGDSFAEGVGFQIDETFAGLIARQLAGHGTELLNAGVQSYAPSIYYAKTRYLLDSVGLVFDELIVFLDVSDIMDEAVLYHLDSTATVRFSLDRAASLKPWALQWIEKETPKGPRGFRVRLKLFLKDNSVVVHVLDALKDRFETTAPAPVTAATAPARADRPLTDLPQSLWTVRDSLMRTFGREGLALAAEHMDRLAALLRRRGIALTVVVYPWPGQVMYDSVNSIQVTYWSQWAERAGARFIDLFPPFFRDADREATIRKYFLPGDAHFNAEGNKLFSEEFLARYAPATASSHD